MLVIIFETLLQVLKLSQFQVYQRSFLIVQHVNLNLTSVIFTPIFIYEGKCRPYSTANRPKVNNHDITRRNRTVSSGK